MIVLLEEIPLLVDRITAKEPGFVQVKPFEDWPDGGNFEADNLPACFVGDSGGLIAFSGRQSSQAAIASDVFISVVTPRGAGSFVSAKALLNSAVNAVLYEPDGTRWRPSGHDLPFDMQGDRPEAIYFPTFVIRNIVFTSNRESTQ